MIVLSCETPHTRAQTQTQKQGEVRDLCDMGSNLCLLIGSDICTTHGMFSSLQSFLSGQANTGQPVQALRQGVCVCVCKCVCVCVCVPKPTILKAALRQENNWKLLGENWKRLECREDVWHLKTLAKSQYSARSSALYTNAEKNQDDDRVCLLQVWECPLNLFMLVFCCMFCYAMQAALTTWAGLVLKRKCQKG